MLFYRTRDDDSIDIVERHKIEGDFMESYRERNEKYGTGPEKMSKFMLETLEDIQSPNSDINESKLFFDEVSKSKIKQKKEKKYKVVYMTEGASVKTRILFYNKNIYKISFARFLNVMSYLMRRVAIFPLLIPLDFSQNFMNLIYLSVTFSFSIKAKQNFEEAIKLHLPAFSFLMFLQLIADYLVKIYINL
jgi:hypothetical protein